MKKKSVFILLCTSILLLGAYFVWNHSTEVSLKEYNEKAEALREAYMSFDETMHAVLDEKDVSFDKANDAYANLYFAYRMWDKQFWNLAKTEKYAYTDVSMQNPDECVNWFFSIEDIYDPVVNQYYLKENGLGETVKDKELHERLKSAKEDILILTTPFE